MEEKLYPIKYNGKLWEEDEVSDLFHAFYHTKLALDCNMSVYVSEGERIFPDGSWVEN